MRLESLEERRLLDTTALCGEATSPCWSEDSAITLSCESPGERLFALRVEDAVGRIYEIDPESGAELDSFPAPESIDVSGYQGLALGSTNLFFIDGSGTGPHTLYELDTTTGAVIDADLVGDTDSAAVSGLAYLNGLVYLGRSDDRTLLVWDPDSDQEVGVLQVDFAISGGLTGACDLNVLFDSNRSGDVVSISPEDGSVLAHFETAYSLSGGLAYVNGELLGGDYSKGTIYRIDPGTGNVSGAFSAPGSGKLSGLAGDGAAAALGEISGTVWNDLNGDGQIDADEPGLEGWIVYFDENENGCRDADEAYSVTDADGLYTFTDVSPGTYAVVEEVDPEWIQTCPGSTPSQGRVFALWSDETSGVGTIVELNPDEGVIVNSFYAPSTLSRAGVQGLAVGPDRLYYVEGDSMLLCELDLNTGAVIDSHVLSPSHDEPISGLAYLSGKLYLVQHGYNRLLAWDPDSETLSDVATLSEIDLGGSLTGCSDEGLLFCGNGNGDIYGIDPATGTVERSFSTNLGQIRGGMAYLDGELIVGAFSDSETAYRIDPVSGEVLGAFVLDGAEYGLLAGLGGDGALGTADSTPRFVSLAQGQIVDDCNFGNVITSVSAVFYGTDGDDVFVVTASATGHVVSVNGTCQVLDSAQISEIHIDGLGGNDRITVVGTDGNETATLSPGSVDLVGAVYEIHGTNVEIIAVDGGGGEGDKATLSGSTGSNRLSSYSTYSLLTDSNRAFSHRVEGFESVAVHVPSGETNYAFLYDSPGSDDLEATPDAVHLSREDEAADLSATGFQKVYAYSRSGGEDSASLNGSDGGRNRLYSFSQQTVFTDLFRSYYFLVQGFGSIFVDSPGDGLSYAYFYDSPEDDCFQVSAVVADMNRGGTWSDTTATGFSRVYAHATCGTDSALLTGSEAGGNRYRGTPAYCTLTDSVNSGYFRVSGFGSVTATGSSSDMSGDRAYLYDSGGDDTLTAAFADDDLYHGAVLSDAALSYENWICDFDLVYARSCDSDKNDTVDADNETLAYCLILWGTW